MISIQELLREFKDPFYVSRALDELLELGLLRALDMATDNNKNIFTRVFLSGGEYNAVQVSRIADTLRFEPKPHIIDFKAAEDESIELWGT